MYATAEQCYNSATETNFMNQISLIISFVLALLAIGFFVYSTILLRKVRNLRTGFTTDHQPVNLEEILNVMAGKIKYLENGQEKLEELFGVMASNHQADLQKLGVVRFNSLNDQGGNLSFSMALMDEEDNGLVITNMHGRESSRTYAKALTHGSSDTPLTEEEKEAVLKASTQWHVRVKPLSVSNQIKK